MAARVGRLWREARVGVIRAEAARGWEAATLLAG
jgi:hypothetical protein